MYYFFVIFPCDTFIWGDMIIRYVRVATCDEVGYFASVVINLVHVKCAFRPTSSRPKLFF